MSSDPRDDDSTPLLSVSAKSAISLSFSFLVNEVATAACILTGVVPIIAIDDKRSDFSQTLCFDFIRSIYVFDH